MLSKVYNYNSYNNKNGSLHNITCVTYILGDNIISGSNENRSLQNGLENILQFYSIKNSLIIRLKNLFDVKKKNNNNNDSSM